MKEQKETAEYGGPTGPSTPKPGTDEQPVHTISRMPEFCTTRMLEIALHIAGERTDAERKAIIQAGDKCAEFLPWDGMPRLLTMLMQLSLGYTLATRALRSYLALHERQCGRSSALGIVPSIIRRTLGLVRQSKLDEGQAQTAMTRAIANWSTEGSGSDVEAPDVPTLRSERSNLWGTRAAESERMLRSHVTQWSDQVPTTIIKNATID